MILRYVTINSRSSVIKSTEFRCKTIIIITINVTYILSIKSLVSQQS